MSKEMARFIRESRDAQHVELISLRLFENSHFELAHESGGVFGSISSLYMGSYSYEGENMILSIRQVRNYRYTIQDEEPIEETVPYHETIQTKSTDDITISFNFPESSENWAVTLHKEL